MSNIKVVDNIQVNFNLLKHMNCLKVSDTEYYIDFCYEIDSPFARSGIYCSKEECEARIKQILEKQNNKEVEI